MLILFGETLQDLENKKITWAKFRISNLTLPTIYIWFQITRIQVLIPQLSISTLSLLLTTKEVTVEVGGARGGGRKKTRGAAASWGEQNGYKDLRVRHLKIYPG